MNLSSDDCDEQELTRGVRNKFFKNLNIHIANYIYDTIIYNLRLFIYRYKLKRDIKVNIDISYGKSIGIIDKKKFRGRGHCMHRFKSQN